MHVRPADEPPVLFEETPHHLAELLEEADDRRRTRIKIFDGLLHLEPHRKLIDEFNEGGDVELRLAEDRPEEEGASLPSALLPRALPHASHPV